ncbi:MAG: exodeoxyribonuclease III [Methanolobus sp.]|uniref:exodeoxyribonuclease III n=1 Tax=Methanolobus sp. TaxID=1874737 RepID=UPI002731765A|nr:exodeoxyribonuclease III [Methanolobus sp.]MDP2216490.1 exodeoxyribonuclease III [Methanolobus sp.]
MEKIRIISWNVNGIRSVQKKGFLEWLQKEQPDILCIQETKAQKEQLGSELTEVKGYCSYFSSAEKKGYSGVALYTKKEPLSIKCGFGIPKFDREGRILIADYGEFILFNIYFPNGKSSPERLDYKMEFYDAFLEYALELKKQGKKLIICGDVNTAHREIDLARPKENETISGFLPEERAWIDRFLSQGYVDTFRFLHPEPGQYTWWSVRSGARARNVGWRIDYFYASENAMENIRDSFIMPEVPGSDHCPLGIVIEL